MCVSNDFEKNGNAQIIYLCHFYHSHVRRTISDMFFLVVETQGGIGRIS